MNPTASFSWTSVEFAAKLINWRRASVEAEPMAELAGGASL